MKMDRPSRLRRRRDARRDTVRRMLAAGAVIGLIVGLVAQAAVGGVDQDIRGLVRLALLLPAGVFVAWWLLVPGLSLEGDEITTVDDQFVDADARLRQIEAAFDPDAVPRMGSRHPRVGTSGESGEELRRSVRRPKPTGDVAHFGIRRPPVIDVDRADGS